jgi:glycosyl transferase, family 25
VSRAAGTAREAAGSAGQAVPVHLINLDRRGDRRAFMETQLAAMGVAWERVPAVDAETASDAEIGAEVALDGHLIRMGRGSQCCALTNFAIWRRLLAGDAPAAVLLQDDTELSPDLAGFVRSADWIPAGIGLIQFEKWSKRATSKLLGPPLGRSPVPGREIRRLHSRTGGAGCYLITRAAAARFLEAKGLLRFPIDHLLFNINISPLAREAGAAIVVPALARQAWGRFESDISPGTRAREKSLGARLTRLGYEVNLAPRQLGAIVFGGARVRPVAFAARTGDQAGSSAGAMN